LNSSGTGKSRLVDEVSKSIITVPMCLRPEGSHGLIRIVLAFYIPVHHSFRVSASR